MGVPRVVNSVAPIRVCDVGGWTDTWFARHGAVFNIAVSPRVEVQIEAIERRTGNERVTIHALNFGDVYSVDPDKIVYGKHPLIEAAIDAMRLPSDRAFRITLHSDAPPGAAAGTSAAVSVALVGALHALSSDAPLLPYEAATLAHRLETEKLGLQCGIQDQLASAYGGINLIEMYEFPHARVHSLRIPDALCWELEHRLATVYVGAPHRSSEVHQKVIADLGPNARDDARLAGMRRLAIRAKDAVVAGAWASLGAVMDENTGFQRALHRDLVCDKFEEIIAISRAHGALGCKVNGAGGSGGTLTILTDGNASTKRRLLTALAEDGYPSLPTQLSRRGLRVWSCS